MGNSATLTAQTYHQNYPAQHTAWEMIQMDVKPVVSTQMRVVGSRSEESREWIYYGGRKFSCSTAMATIFLKHARELLENGEEQLVPLLHSGGIELLFVSRATPYSLLDQDDGEHSE